MKEFFDKIKREFSEEGFSLIEVILSLALTGLVFMAVYSLYAVTLKYDTESRYEIIASNLAQEGAEIIRNIRDTNVLNGNEIDFGFSTGTCYPFFYNGDADCDASTHQDKVGIDTEGYYENCSGSCDKETVFKRRCNIIAANSTEIEFTCTVSWESFAIDKERAVTVEGYLTAWQD